MSLNTQFITLWMMFVSGCMLGGILDCYRVLSGQLHLKRWLIPLFDVLYWLTATVLVFRILYWSNFGEVRIFVFLGLIAGAVVYYALFSRHFIRLFRLILRWLAACWRFTVRFFRTFVIMPIVYISRIVLAVLMFFGTVSIFLGKFVLQLVYPLWKILRRPLQHLIKVTWLRAAAKQLRAKISQFRRRS